MSSLPFREERGTAATTTVTTSTATTFADRPRVKRSITADEALVQIEASGYARPCSADPRQVHRVGCAFDSRTRLLSDWKVA